MKLLIVTIICRLIDSENSITRIPSSSAPFLMYFLPGQKIQYVIYFLCAMFPCCPLKLIMVLVLEIINPCVTLKTKVCDGCMAEWWWDVVTLCKIPLLKLSYIFNGMNAFVQYLRWIWQYLSPRVFFIIKYVWLWEWLVFTLGLNQKVLLGSNGKYL